MFDTMFDKGAYMSEVIYVPGIALWSKVKA